MDTKASKICIVIPRSHHKASILLCLTQISPLVHQYKYYYFEILAYKMKILKQTISKRPSTERNLNVLYFGMMIH